MSIKSRDTLPTRSAQIELRAEHGFVREGHALLDQKRKLLAAEMTRWLERYDAARARLLEAHRAATVALAEAVARHGIEEIERLPRAESAFHVESGNQNFLGVPLIELGVTLKQRPALVAPANPSPEARRLSRAFAELAERAVALVAPETNLRRLLGEYRRAERRARALENVILPELAGTLKAIDETLEEQDQEEAARVRLGTDRG